MGKLDKGRLFSNLYQFISKCYLHSSEIILSCYVAVILEMKDYRFAILTPIYSS